MRIAAANASFSSNMVGIKPSEPEVVPVQPPKKKGGKSKAKKPDKSGSSTEKKVKIYRIKYEKYLRAKPVTGSPFDALIAASQVNCQNHMKCWWPICSLPGLLIVVFFVQNTRLILHSSSLDYERWTIQFAQWVETQRKFAVQLEVGGRKTRRLRHVPKKLLSVSQNQSRRAHGGMRFLCVGLPSGLPRPSAVWDPERTVDVSEPRRKLRGHEPGVDDQLDGTSQTVEQTRQSPGEPRSGPTGILPESSDRKVVSEIATENGKTAGFENQSAEFCQTTLRSSHQGFPGRATTWGRH